MTEHEALKQMDAARSILEELTRGMRGIDHPNRTTGAWLPATVYTSLRIASDVVWFARCALASAMEHDHAD